MADKKISELNNAALPLTGAELVPIVQDGETVKVELSEISGNNANLISTDPDNAIELGTDGKLFSAVGGGVQQYKFLLSQSGGDDPQTATSGTLTQGVTYEIVAFETGDNFIPSGAPNNTVGTKWIANSVAPTWSNGSEIGWNTGNPIIVDSIGTNTIGNFWFEWIVDGVWYCKSDGLFTLGKTYINIGSHYFESGFVFARDLNINEFIFESQQGGTNINGLILNTSFEIIVNN